MTVSALNVLHVTPYFDPAWAYGRVAHEVAALARAQVALGHRVTVLTTDALAPHERLPSGEVQVDGMRVIRVRNVNSATQTWLRLSTPLGIGRIAQALFAERSIGVVHLHEVRTVENVRVAGVAPRTASLVVSPHGTLESGAGETWAHRVWDRIVGDRLLARVRQLVAGSEAEARSIRALYEGRGLPLRDEQVTIVPGGFDLSAFATPPERATAMTRFDLAPGPIVLFIGRLAEGTGLDVLLSAFAQLRNDVPGAQLVIAGPDHGALSQARAQAAALKLESCVRFPGHLTAADARAAFAVADLFARPAADVGFPQEPLHALTAGVPVLLGADCPFHEAAAAGAGLIVALGTRPWADAMRSLLQDASLAEQMGHRGRSIADGYTWRAAAVRVQAVYERAMSAREP